MAGDGVEGEEMLHEEGVAVTDWATPACYVCGEARKVIPKESDCIASGSEEATPQTSFGPGPGSGPLVLLYQGEVRTPLLGGRTAYNVCKTVLCPTNFLHASWHSHPPHLPFSPHSPLASQAILVSLILITGPLPTLSLWASALFLSLGLRPSFSLWASAPLSLSGPPPTFSLGLLPLSLSGPPPTSLTTPPPLSLTGPPPTFSLSLFCLHPSWPIFFFFFFLSIYLALSLESIPLSNYPRILPLLASLFRLFSPLLGPA